jgi:hypothetical protein
VLVRSVRAHPDSRRRPTTVREATTAQVTDGARDRIRVTLATPGWGSSGYYAPEVLEAAATDRVFPAGIACHVDHPRRSDDTELPERSVETMAAVLTEDATWDADTQELVAEARLFPHKAWLADMADSIGMSIMADADISEAEVEGRRGRVIERIVQGRSVDFVTKAGRGGRFTLAESARPEQVDRRAVRSGVAESTAEQTREALSAAVRDAHGGTDMWSYVEDFDDTTVWSAAVESAVKAAEAEIADYAAARQPVGVRLVRLRRRVRGRRRAAQRGRRPRLHPQALRPEDGSLTMARNERFHDAERLSLPSPTAPAPASPSSSAPSSASPRPRRARAATPTTTPPSG